MTVPHKYAWLTFASAGPSRAKDPQPLTKAQLKVLLSGNSLVGNGKGVVPRKPYDWISYHAPDGTLTMRLKPAWGGLKLVGRWWLTDKNEWCRVFDKPKMKEGCWHMFRESKSLRFVPASGVAVEGNAVMLKGDRLGLIEKK